MSEMENVDRRRSTSLYSHGRLLRIDQVMVCKIFYSALDLGLESFLRWHVMLAREVTDLNRPHHCADQRLEEDIS